MKGCLNRTLKKWKFVVEGGVQMKIRLCVEYGGKTILTHYTYHINPPHHFNKKIPLNRIIFNKFMNCMCQRSINNNRMI